VPYLKEYTNSVQQIYGTIYSISVNANQ